MRGSRLTAVYSPRVRLRALGWLSVLSALLVFGQPSAPGPPHPQSPPCADVHFVGVAGSGEIPVHRGGELSAAQLMGSKVETIYKEFAAEVKGTTQFTVDSYGVDYPAVSTTGPRAILLAPSVRLGVKDLVTHLNYQADRCRVSTGHAQRVVLTGYSQGAWVIDRALWEPDSGLHAAARARLAGVVLVGDPEFSAGDGNAQGTFDPTLTGMARRAVVTRIAPGDGQAGEFVRRNTRSFCQKSDPVCNFSWRSLLGCAHIVGACPHTNYAAYYSSAADFLRQRLR